jgi:nucleotide-binding universal stress UspA family protein
MTNHPALPLMRVKASRRAPLRIFRMYTHLLVAVDDSKLSERTMLHSIELARRLSAAITGFIAEPLGSSEGSSFAYSAAATAMSERNLVSHAHEVLDRFALLAQEASVPFHGHYVQTHDIDLAIVGAARRYGCDLIVMATHGRGPLGEFLFGSHTKSVISRCELPLLVLH